MLKSMLVGLLALAVISAETEAFARGGAGGGGRSYGGGHSRGSHSHKQRSTNGFAKKCKTNACFKKHPSGEYYVSPRKN